MKKTLIACLLFAGIGTVTAQTSAQATWENNSPDNYRASTPAGIQQDNVFANTEISTDNGIITFSDLPELKKATWAIVTDPAGNLITQKRVNPAANILDLHRLPKGEMYFLTLVYKNKSKKGFVLHM